MADDAGPRSPLADGASSGPDSSGLDSDSSQEPVAERLVPLPCGRSLVVRSATLDDLDGLAALYDELSVEDRHSRFFSAYRPTRPFLEGWVRRNEGGGVVLVAVDADGVVVGDVGYALLPNGDGELALTVSPKWRGWLGAYLLDVLVEEAAARGVPNLEASVLTTNRPMQAVIGRRGYAVTGRDGWSVVEVAIGTHGTVPEWPGARDRPRLLVEATGGRWHAESDARRAGYQVVTCPGPAARSGRPCPLLSGGSCPLVDGADAIVLALPPSDPRTAELLAVHRAGDAARPVLDELAGARPGVVDELTAALAAAGPAERHRAAEPDRRH